MKKILVVILCFFMLNKVSAISASSYVVIDSDTNNVLLGSNIDSPRLIASITKIMTI